MLHFTLSIYFYYGLKHTEFHDIPEIPKVKGKDRRAITQFNLILNCF